MQIAMALALGMALCRPFRIVVGENFQLLLSMLVQPSPAGHDPSKQINQLGVSLVWLLFLASYF